MPGSKELLVGLARQMYDDIRFITEHNPTQVVDEDTARMFNTLLLEVQQVFASTPLVFSFNEMSPRTLKYKDALIVMGQMYRLLRLLTQGAKPAAPAAPAPRRAPKQDSGDIDPSLDEGDYEEDLEQRRSQMVGRLSDGTQAKDPVESDPELYGDGPPPSKLNPDGTIPFSLMDEERESQF